MTRAAILKGDKAPLVQFSGSLIPLSRGQAGSSDLSTQKGKVTVLYFFSANCGRCIAASQQLGSLFLTIPQSELTILGVMPSTDTYDEALETTTKERVPFAVVQDISDKTYNTYGIEGFPTFCIIDASGKVIKYCYANEMRFLVMAEVIKNRRMRSATPIAAAQPQR